MPVRWLHTGTKQSHPPQFSRLPALLLTHPLLLSCPALPVLSVCVYSTNTSYQRWDEARKMWGLIVNRSRDVTRMGLGYIPASQPELQAMWCRWMAAYP